MRKPAQGCAGSFVLKPIIQKKSFQLASWIRNAANFLAKEVMTIKID
jgi:hypothetical protein